MSTLTASIDVPPVPASVPAARHLLVDLLRAWGAPQDPDDAALLVTELVANVIDHVQGEACLTLEMGVLFGVPMPPEKIKELMHQMNQPKLAHVLKEEEDSGAPPSP